MKQKKHIITVSYISEPNFAPSVILTHFFISVDDEVAIEIVKKHVLECEAKGKSWIVQGFPRTKAQALALQKLDIIPDKFILLSCKPSASISRLKNNLLAIN